MTPEEKAEYKQKYTELKKRGEDFYPYEVFKDTVVCLGILVLLVLWSVYNPPHLDPVADPSSTGYVPRPDWYFLFLFQILKYFPGDLEVIGTVVIPGIAGTFLLLLPFIDRNPETRPSKRPIAVAGLFVSLATVTALTYLGASESAPGGDSKSASHGSAPAAKAPESPTAPTTQAAATTGGDEAGKKVFETTCTMCHGPKGDMMPVANLNDPAFVSSIDVASAVKNGKGGMPAQSQLSAEQVDQVAAYVKATAGKR